MTGSSSSWSYAKKRRRDANYLPNWLKYLQTASPRVRLVLGTCDKDTFENILDSDPREAHAELLVASKEPDMNQVGSYAKQAFCEVRMRSGPYQGRPTVTASSGTIGPFWQKECKFGLECWRPACCNLHPQDDRVQHLKALADYWAQRVVMMTTNQWREGAGGRPTPQEKEGKDHH